MTEKDSKPRYSVKSPSRGGSREGAGRPKGSTDKITARSLLEACQAVNGQPFERTLVEGYRDSIINQDRKTRTIYEKMILDKVATTMFEAEITASDDVVQAKQAAFAAAIALIAGSTESTK